MEGRRVSVLYIRISLRRAQGVIFTPSCVIFTPFPSKAHLRLIGNLSKRAKSALGTRNAGVHIVNQMRVRQLNSKFVPCAVVCALLAILLSPLCGPRFSSRWGNLKDGMTQEEVRRACGAPTWTGKIAITGAGWQQVSRWQYKRGHCVYCVDFDYIGPGGAPAVYNTLCYREEGTWPDWMRAWAWPSWLPWNRPKARA